GGDRRRDGVRRHAAALPERGARLEVIGPGPLRAVDDHLGAALVLDDQRRVPRRLLVALGAPAVLAGAGIEADERGAGFLVPVEEQGVAVDDRRDRLAPAEARAEPAEVALPLQPAGQVVAVDAE